MEDNTLSLDIIFIFIYLFISQPHGKSKSFLHFSGVSPWTFDFPVQRQPIASFEDCDVTLRAVALKAFFATLTNLNHDQRIFFFLSSYMKNSNEI